VTTKKKSYKKTLPTSANYNEKKGPKLSETILLASVPIIAYFLQFMYSFGLYSYYGIPLSFIEINLVKIFLVILLISISLGGIFFTFIILRSLFKQHKPLHFPFAILTTGIYLILYSWITSNVYIGMQAAISQLFMLIGIIITIFALLYIIYTLYAENLISKSSFFFSGPFRYFFEELHKVRSFYLFLPFTIVILSVAAWNFGQITAKEANYYYVIDNSNPNNVVLALQNDKFICSYYDPTKKVLLPTLFFVEIEDSIQITMKKIGPLKPAPETLMLLQSLPSLFSTSTSVLKPSATAYP
jgi:hypothetical protein